MGKSTTGEVGRDDLEVEESPEAGRSRNAQDFLRTGRADDGASAVEVDAAEGRIGVEGSAEGEGATAAVSGTSTEGVASGLATAAALVTASLASGPSLVFGGQCQRQTQTYSKRVGGWGLAGCRARSNLRPAGRHSLRLV